MRYLNAAEAARALGIGDKTIRRWLKDGRKFPSAIVKVNGEWAIPEDEVEAMKQHRSKYASVHVTSQDQSTNMSAFAAKLAALEQEIAELKQGALSIAENAPIPPTRTPAIDAMPQPIVPQNHPTIAKEEKRTYKPRKSGLPEGCILASDFAKMYGVNPRTFNDHMLLGLGPGLIGESTDTIPRRDQADYSERPNGRKRKKADGTTIDEMERYLTPEQQDTALKFWNRHGVVYHLVDDSKENE